MIAVTPVDTARTRPSACARARFAFPGLIGTLTLVIVLIAAVLSPGARAEAGPPPPPPAPAGVSLDSQLGAQVPADITLTDQLGRTVALADLLESERPVILLLAYYRCPMLCGLTIGGVAKGLAELGWTPGEDFRVVTISFDPRDGPADAERARTKAIEALGSHLADDQWPFWVGDEAEVRRLADALGFHYAYDDRTDQYAHPSAVFVLTPDGALSRVLYGFEYPALDLRMALVEAGQGKVGTLVEQVLITCYRYDPSTRRYGFWVLGFLRLAGLLVLATVGAALFVLIRRDRQRTRELLGQEAGR
jgi:protein SCO1/2